MQLAERAPAATRRAAATLALVRPAYVLGGLVLAQWLAVAVFAGSVRHEGWLFYQGGDQVWLYSSAVALAEGTLPYALVGWGLSYLLAPVALVAGPLFLDALPAIVLLQVALLLPLALVCVYGIVRTFAGRLYAYGATAAWIAIPYAAIPLFDPRYHERYVEQTLPQALGLTGMADFPSMVCLLVAAYLTLRVVGTGSLPLAVGAGLAVGFAGALKPANLVFVAAPVLALAVSRRYMPIVVAAGGAALPLLALALWKQRGLGELPVLAFAETRLAAGSMAANLNIDRYVPLEWELFGQHEAQLREYFWSVRLLEYAPLAGAFAVWRRLPPAAVLLFTWLALFVLVKGGSPVTSVDTGSFFRLLMPAFPAFFLLAVAIPLLVPLRREREVVAPPPARRAWIYVATAGAVLGVAPLALFAAAPHAAPQRFVYDLRSNVYLPVSDKLAPRVTRTASAVVLTWDPPGTHAGSYYRVYRVGDVGTDTVCAGAGAGRCDLRGELVASTRAPRFTDTAGGDATYRVAYGANWLGDTAEGDVTLISPPVAVPSG